MGGQRQGQADVQVGRHDLMWGTAGEKEGGDRGEAGRPRQCLSGASHWLPGSPAAGSSPHLCFIFPQNQNLDLAPDPSPPLSHPLSDSHAAHPRKSARKLRDVASWRPRSKLHTTDSAQLDPGSPEPFKAKGSVSQLDVGRQPD